MPVAALAIGLLSLLRLNVTPERWLNESICEAVGIAKFTLDPAPCLTIAGITLTYWCIKERDEAAAALGALAGWLTGIPGVDRLILLGVKGFAIMFATIKRKVYEQIRSEGIAEGREEGIAEGREEGIAEGRVETNAEWQAWLDRRTSTGVFVSDDNDPPPTQRKV